MRHLTFALASVLVIGCAASASQSTLPARTSSLQDAQRQTASSTVGPSNNTASCITSCGVFTGSGSTVSGDYAVIGGGYINTASAEWDVVGGGRQNNASGIAATISGGGENVASGYVSSTGGGSHQQASGYKSTIAGGTENTADGDGATIGGGILNGGHGADGVIAGGASNTVSGEFGAIGGGSLNSAGLEGVVAGGYQNAAGPQAAILGGVGNSAGGQYSVVIGGATNSAAGRFALAGGYRSSAPYAGDFVWSDSLVDGAALAAQGANQFVARATGGVTFYTNSALTTGATLAPGSGAWASSSDRHAKANIVAVDDERVLARLVRLPVTAWSYRSEGSVRHIGPMAQDFHATFGVGPDDKHITSIDEDGVAFAAIKALYAQLQTERTEVHHLERELKLLRAQTARGAAVTVGARR
jgi:hypothetical protein